MNRKISLVLVGLVVLVAMVSAGDFNINYGGAKIFTMATNGSLITQNISLTGWITTVGNITTTSGYFVGDGSYLTGITVDDNTTQISYHNVTDIPTCQTTNVLHFDGTDFSCEATTITDNSTQISYHNVTDIPTCTGDDVLTFDGTDLSCTTPSVADWTNNAWLNESQTFAEYNEFTKYVNITEGVRLMSNTSVITRDGVENVNMTIDSSGNFNFNLG